MTRDWGLSAYSYIHRRRWVFVALDSDAQLISRLPMIHMLLALSSRDDEVPSEKAVAYSAQAGAQYTCTSIRCTRERSST